MLILHRTNDGSSRPNYQKRWRERYVQVTFLFVTLFENRSRPESLECEELRHNSQYSPRLARHILATRC
jgi:hypothetical protein